MELPGKATAGRHTDHLVITIGRTANRCRRRSNPYGAEGGEGPPNWGSAVPLPETSRQTHGLEVRPESPNEVPLSSEDKWRAGMIGGVIPARP